ncbi:MAG: hypothetical protein CEE42_15460 [Promethearchaeota archaeon Loki_b31]|nr:MAG: hypothetical protein CEE42_15460 [Candidatus Lokiarchaeota archaeon Loki_b31]
MRILRIVPLPPDYIGGLPLYCKNLSLNLAKRKGIKCDILAPDLLNKQKKVEYLSESIKIIYKKKIIFPKKHFLYPVANIFNFLKNNYKDYDIIHAHGYYFSTTTQCALLRKICTFPFILHIHGGIQTPYNPVSNMSENLQLLIKQKIFDRVVGRFHIESSDKLISVSKPDLFTIVQKYQVNKENCYYIPNAVDISKFKRIKNIERKYITLMATRLSYVKGVDIFIKIIKDLYKNNKNLKFLIIGSGSLRNLVLEAQKKLPITYYPSYPYEKIQEVYNMSKLILITSRTEGVPNIIYESFACETPVISSNVGGISNVISPNINGILFDINNYKTIVRSILNLISDENKLKEYGRNGQKLIEEEYSWEKITEKVYSIYKTML